MVASTVAESCIRHNMILKDPKLLLFELLQPPTTATDLSTLASYTLDSIA